MKGIAFVAGLLATTASAHMQMSKPYPIRSPLNKDADGQKDYSYTNPLSSSGSDYPCKGYAKDKFNSQATYQPGEEYEMELEGSATHDGGSCQIALTYDQGKTFKVIESMLGDCPIDKKYKFTVPSDAPSGEALLAWTWFNKVGNREMYMNCAFVTIGGESKGKKLPAAAPANNAHPKAEGKKASQMQQQKEHAAHPNKEQRDIAWMDTHKKATSFDNLPALFVANVDQEGKCVTIEGEPVNFPMPGDNVVGKAEGKGYKCSGNAPFLGADDASSSNSTSSKDTKDKDTKDKDTKDKDTKDKDTKDKDTKDKDTKDKDTKDKDTKDKDTKDKDTKNKDTEDCKDSAVASADNKKGNATRSDRTSQSMSKIASAFGTPSAHPRVASTEASTNNAFSNYVGTWSCHDGEIICSPDGWSWAMCSNGKPIFMGSVAAGMACRFGQMIAAHW